VRKVDLETLPLYVRAGAVLPMGPLKQYTTEIVDGPFTLTVFPGANGACSLYEDDGESFDFRNGQFTRIEMLWDDGARRLVLRLASGSRLLSPNPIAFEIKLAGSDRVKTLIFKGDQVSVAL
jgi:alpha-glucosidase (family GH31 glycosyl hydrolase)